MELIENQTHKEIPRRIGGSDYFILSPEIKEFLGVAQDAEFEIYFKTEKGKKGRFIAVWLEMVKPK